MKKTNSHLLSLDDSELEGIFGGTELECVWRAR
jgi:hypothetical protein